MWRALSLETGIFAAIFSVQDLQVPGPVDTFLQPSCPSDFEQFESIVSGGMYPRLQMKRRIGEPIHASVLASMKDVDAKQIKSDLWDTAISKWQLIFQLADYPGPIG